MDIQQQTAFNDKEIFSQHKNSKGLRFLVGFFTVFIICALSVYYLIPPNYNLRVGATMESTIYATQQVEDTLSTQELRDRVAAQVAAQYVKDDEITTNQMAHFTTLYSSIINQRNFAYENATLTNEVFVADESVLNSVNSNLEIDLSTAQLNYLINTSQDEVYNGFVEVQGIYSQSLSTGVFDNEREFIKEEIIQNAENQSAVFLDIVDLVLDKTIKANMLYDEAATQAARETAMKEVEPILYNQGEVIVYEGEILNEAQYTVLESLALTNTGISIELNAVLGTLSVILILFILYFLYLFYYSNKIFVTLKYFTLTNVIILVSVSLCLILGDIRFYLMPVALGGLLSASLLNRRVAVMNNLLILGIIYITQSANWNNYTIYIFVISIVAGIYIYDKRKTRFALLLAGCISTVIAFVLGISYALISQNVEVISFMDMLYTVVNIFVSAVACVGLTILFENIFNVLTPSKLVDLSSTENHLLKQLINKAPGTYHHSVMVANLADGAAKAIGADALLTRVAAYYHDVGKIAKPMYFKENQQGENIHDSLDPVSSVKIITHHTLEGYRLAQKELLPVEIRDIIVQHHGTTKAKYFYDKAVEMGLAIREEDFRYKGPKPQTKEAAIIMLADTIEAVMRLEYDESTSKAVIKSMIESKINEGQLDQCDLSFKDVLAIENSFYETLKSIYHKRISYKDPKSIVEGEESLVDGSQIEGDPKSEVANVEELLSSKE